MTGFQRILRFFNSKRSNKVFTRAEYFMALKNAGLRHSTMDTVRCYLQNAGYLSDDEKGVYRKLRPIPQDLTYTTLYREAYPKPRKRGILSPRDQLLRPSKSLAVLTVPRTDR